MPEIESDYMATASPSEFASITVLVVDDEPQIVSV